MCENFLDVCKRVFKKVPVGIKGNLFVLESAQWVADVYCMRTWSIYRNSKRL